MNRDITLVGRVGRGLLLVDGTVLNARRGAGERGDGPGHGPGPFVPEGGPYGAGRDGHARRRVWSVAVRRERWLRDVRVRERRPGQVHASCGDAAVCPLPPGDCGGCHSGRAGRREARVQDGAEHPRLRRGSRSVAPPVSRVAAYTPELPGEYPYVTGRRLDPYNQNVLKGDLADQGQSLFLILSATSETPIEYRTLPTPSGVSTEEPGRGTFFGACEQMAVLPERHLQRRAVSRRRGVSAEGLGDSRHARFQRELRRRSRAQRAQRLSRGGHATAAARISRSRKRSAR